MQAVARARSAELTEALEPVIQETAIELAFAHAVLDRVRARVQAAEVEPTVRDGLAAAKLIADSGKAAAGDVDELAFMAYKVEMFEIVQGIISEEQLKELQYRCDASNRERATLRRR